MKELDMNWGHTQQKRLESERKSAQRMTQMRSERKAEARSLCILRLVKEFGFYSTSQSFQKHVLQNASVTVCSKNKARKK